MDTANVGYSYHLPTGGWNYKIRNTLSQFSDLFSEFNKYIAPAYHHDRCERSVQMRVYTMHKGEFVMVFVAFYAFLGLGVFIGLAGPSPTSTSAVSGNTLLDNSTHISSGPFHLHSPALGTRAQQLWLLAEILTDNNDEEIFDKSFQISISIDGILSDHTSVNLIPESAATNRTQHLKCTRRSCEEVLVLHLGSLEYTHYVLSVRFYGLREFHKRYYIRDVVFYFKTYNPGFTQMETWFRFIFLLTTFTISCWFAHSLRKYSMQDWSIEQKWLSILLPLLLLYNDPIYPLRLVSDSCFAPLVDALFQTAFLAGLMLSWLALYHGLRQNVRSFVSFYLLKVSLVTCACAPGVVLAVWQHYYAHEDPTFNYRTSPHYPGVTERPQTASRKGVVKDIILNNFHYGTDLISMIKIMFFSAITVYFIYLIILIAKAYSDLRNMPFFDIRLRCLSLVVGSVCAVVWWLALVGWGPAALQDHWAAQPRRHYATSAPFMALYGLFNFKLYTLAYLFSPGGTGSIHDAGITKDNPAFSMINDSDEEVIYGSEEESRRPLTPHSRAAPRAAPAAPAAPHQDM